MMPADMEVPTEGTVDVGGLDFGISLYHLRMLCENPWEGGGGYTPNQVAEMTPDQIYFRLCDKHILAKQPRGGRVVSMSATALKPDKEGYINVRTEDGKLIRTKLAAPVKEK